MVLGGTMSPCPPLYTSLQFMAFYNVCYGSHLLLYPRKRMFVRGYIGITLSVGPSVRWSVGLSAYVKVCVQCHHISAMPYSIVLKLCTCLHGHCIRSHKKFQKFVLYFKQILPLLDLEISR